MRASILAVNCKLHFDSHSHVLDGLLIFPIKHSVHKISLVRLLYGY